MAKPFLVQRYGYNISEFSIIDQRATYGSVALVDKLRMVQIFLAEIFEVQNCSRKPFVVQHYEAKLYMVFLLQCRIKKDSTNLLFVRVKTILHEYFY